MLYSEKGDYKLHVVANNPSPPIAGAPRKVILTVNHIEYYDATPYSYYQPAPSEEQVRRLGDWKIAGDKRTWRVSHVQQQMKPATKIPSAMVTSYLIILEQVVINPEKDLDDLPKVKSAYHLRKFNNLIVEEEV